MRKVEEVSAGWEAPGWSEEEDGGEEVSPISSVTGPCVPRHSGSLIKWLLCVSVKTVFCSG